MNYPVPDFPDIDETEIRDFTLYEKMIQEGKLQNPSMIEELPEDFEPKDTGQIVEAKKVDAV